MRAALQPASPAFPRVAVDAILLYKGRIVLVKRGNDPFRDRYALPGGFVEFGEALEDAVEREVSEETGLAAEVEQLVGVYGDPDRDPRGHTISIAYVLHSYGGTLKAATDAAAVRLVPLTRVPKLAFDHSVMVRDFLRSTSRAQSTPPSRGRPRSLGGRESRKPSRRGPNLARP